MSAATRPPLPYEFLPKVPAFAVTSTDIADGEPIRRPQLSGVFDAGGQDISPHLSWSGFPAETKSFAITCYDPDAPTGSGFWHWAIADVPAEVTELPTGAGSPERSPMLPRSAIALRGDAGVAGFLGAAPPVGHGPHRYVYAVHASDVEMLDVDLLSTPAMLGFNLFSHTLARALIIPTCER
jgi:Raf kinase inhibitor-like YbhB/YbcL family protein